MRSLLPAGIAIVTIISGAVGQACADGPGQEINGNWYCQAVQAITYTNFGSVGSYNKISLMDQQSGTCGSEPYGYSGAMAPMDEEVSVHFRGPLQLKQFAFYSPGSSTSSKRDVRNKARRRSYKHFHARDKQIRGVQDNHEATEKRAVGDMVTATINGQVVSWVNQYSGPGAEATATSEVAEATTAATSVTSATLSVESAVPSVNAGPGDWARQAYYNAENGTDRGLVFLNHMGGQGSGVFDDTWGNSLSFASLDALSGSPGPQTLADTLLEDNSEVVIMTNTPCMNNDCGTVRPGTVAYHGFDGPQKIFLMEFSMPLSGKTGFNADMPAVWMLNAQIPNTLQYGQADCSCWTSGCGELDLFEILDSGNTRAKSTWHGNNPGGDSNFFNRPTNTTMKTAIIFDEPASSARIIVLPAGTDFPATLASADVNGIINAVTDPTQSVTYDLSS